VNNVMVAEMQQFATVWPQCVARAWQDEQFRETLKRDPAKTLRESYQFTVPSGISLQVVEGEEAQRAQAADTLLMVIPPKPEMELQEVAFASVEDCGPGNGNGNGPRPCFTFTATAC
jgi:ribosomally synthesized peptide (two-chain TOMM family)